MKTSQRKTLFEKKDCWVPGHWSMCKDGLLPSVKHNVLREYVDVFNIHLWSILLLLLAEWFLVSYLMSLSVDLDGNIIVFWSRMCLFTTLWIESISRFEPWLFHSYNFEIVHSWYLISFSGWYQHVWCLLYTNDVIPRSALCMLPVPGSVGVACSLMLLVSCEGMGCEPISLTCNSSSWWGCEY